MTTELIPIATTEGRKTVNARDLHAFLESRKAFATWIKHRIKQGGLIEGEDYILEVPKRENQVGHGGDRRMTEYFLSVESAKHLAMIERNEKGKQARAYFIECERQLQSVALPSNYIEALANLLESEREKERLKLTVAQQAPAVEFVQRYVLASGLFGIRGRQRYSDCNKTPLWPC